jgi:hypothetical protein
MLQHDFQEVGGDLVSLALVADPFGQYDLPFLHRCFRDVVNPFKSHLIVDLKRSLGSFVSNHHRRNARKSLERLRVEECKVDHSVIEDWLGLYENLVRRHNIKGIASFSKSALAKQLAVPGIVVIRALHEGEVVGMLLWYTDNDVAYYHLGAFNDRGYSLKASFALFWSSIKGFSDAGYRWLNLGAGSGIKTNREDGLTRFKKGWATGVRPAYFCGIVFNPSVYAQLCKSHGASGTNYFPAHRSAEFM